MDWANEWWVLILGPGLVFLVVGFFYFTRSRAFTFRSAAAQLGLIALQGLNPICEEEKRLLTVFSGGSAKITNLFGDRVNSPSRLLFDLANSGAAQALTPSNQTVAAFAAPERIPDFQIVPATLDGAAATPGPPPLQFDSHADFGRRYSLHVNDEISVRAFFTPSRLDCLMGFDPGLNWSIEKTAHWLIVYRQNVLLSTTAIPDAWQKAQALANLFLEPR